MTANSTPAVASRFHVWMAAACALIACGGFAPTYWLQLVPGTFIGPPLLHIHSALFSAWTLLLRVVVAGTAPWLAVAEALAHIAN